MSKPPRIRYKTNRPDCNAALKRRGSLAIWLDPEMEWKAPPRGRRGRQQIFSDTAIQTCLRMKVMFGMALLQATGFVESRLAIDEQAMEAQAVEVTSSTMLVMLRWCL